MGRNNLAWARADARCLPLADAVFDAVLCHSVLKTVGEPADVVAELRRVANLAASSALHPSNTAV